MHNKRIPFAKPSIGTAERQAVESVLLGSQLTQGPQVAAFEDAFVELVGGGHAVAVSSCMAALHLAYLSLDIGPGDDVLCPALSHVATALAIEQVGARPIFVDCDPQTGNVTQEGLAAAQTQSTRAVTLVHFLGQPCEMLNIVPWAEKGRLRVIEDCALALGAEFAGYSVGLWGDIGCFSFYPTKLITTGEGGMLLSRDNRAAVEAKAGRAFGVVHSPEAQAGDYDVGGKFPGLNYRMPETAAALGCAQLRRAKEFIAIRRTRAYHLKGLLSYIPQISFIAADDFEQGVPYALCVKFLTEDMRNRVQAALGRAGVETSIYYPRPIPAMRYFVDQYAIDPRAYPHADAICRQTLCLPCYPGLTGSDMAYIAEQVRKAVRQCV